MQSPLITIKYRKYFEYDISISGHKMNGKRRHCTRYTPASQTMPSTASPSTIVPIHHPSATPSIDIPLIFTCIFIIFYFNFFFFENNVIVECWLPNSPPAINSNLKKKKICCFSSILMMINKKTMKKNCFIFWGHSNISAQWWWAYTYLHISFNIWICEHDMTKHRWGIQYDEIVLGGKYVKTNDNDDDLKVKALALCCTWYILKEFITT